MKIYLAHPITGMTSDQVIDYYENTKRLMESFGLEVLQPMTAKGYFRTEKEVFKSGDYKYNPVSTNHAIFERDNWMVHQSDIVLVDLTGAPAVSIGCMMELAWAADLRKHTVVVMDAKGIHNHAFVKEAADILFDTFPEAVEYLGKLAKQEA